MKLCDIELFILSCIQSKNVNGCWRIIFICGYVTILCYIDGRHCFCNVITTVGMQLFISVALFPLEAFVIY